MKKILVALFSVLFSAPVFSQDELNWIMWECESTDNNAVGYVPVGHRTTLLRYEASWPSTETKEVLKCRGGNCTSLGQISGGEHLLEDVYDIPLTNGYWETYPLTLQVNGNSTAEIFVTTEPTPLLSVEVDLLHTTDGDSVIITSASRTQLSANSGWGLIFPFCTTHPIIQIVEISTLSEGVVFKDTVECVLGQSTTFITGFMYKGPYTELCTQVWMERLDISPVPTFAPREIIITDEVCMMAGGSITTGQEALKEDSPFLVFPNPCREALFLSSSSVPVTWRVTNMLSSAIMTGRGKVIDTRSWPSGMYILELEGAHKVTRIIRE